MHSRVPQSKPSSEPAESDPVGGWEEGGRLLQRSPSFASRSGTQCAPEAVYDLLMRSWLLSIDVAVVVVFVALGRETHDEGNAFGAFVETAAPFVLALGGGWLIARIWQAPSDLKRGAVVAATTVIGGMALRRLVFSEGTAFSFILVATTFLSAGLIGWRAIALRRGSFSPSAGAG